MSLIPGGEASCLQSIDLERKYSYTPLREDVRQIRLIHILPGVWDDALSCQLHIVSLEEGPDYRALSYTWADPNPTIAILLDGYRFHVGLNLGKVLKRLRRATEKMIIWIDALCINQTDFIEKEIQVDLMKDIYEGCEEVMMWLGEPEGDLNFDRQVIENKLVPWNDLGPDLDLGSFDETMFGGSDALAALSLVYIVSRNKPIHEWPFLVQDDDKTSWKATENFKKAATGLQKLANLPYWSRIWIVQEVVLPQVATVVYGPWRAPWSMFADCAKNLMLHATGGNASCCGAEFLKLDNEIWSALEKLYYEVNPLVHFQTIRRFGSSGNQGLQALLQNFISREATDKRDKVYALFSLVNPKSTFSESKLPKAKYANTTVHQAYERAALYIIQSTQNLNILTNRHLFHGNSPSWVPDWERPPNSDMWQQRWEWELPLSRYWLYNAAKDTCCKAQPVLGSQLMLLGVLVDVLEAVGNLRVSGQKDTAGLTCEELLALAELPNDLPQPYISGNTWREACWRTICADTVLDSNEKWRRMTHEDAQKGQKWCSIKKSQPWSASSEAAPQFCSSVTSGTVNKRPFVTRKGYLGIGPYDVKVGDVVYILKGSNVPMVLRNKSELTARLEPQEGNVHQIEVFSLIGDSYVHGIMDGEYFEANKDSFAPLLLH